MKLKCELRLTNKHHNHNDDNNNGSEQGRHFHFLSCDPLVLLQHRRSSPQQVLALQLWLPIPNLPHNVSHVGLCHPQLLLHRLPQGRPSPDAEIEASGPQDRHSQPRILRLRRRRQHLTPIPRRLLQPGRRRHHALLHRALRLPRHLQERGLAYVRRPRPRRRRRRHRQRSMTLCAFFDWIDFCLEFVCA